MLALEENISKITNECGIEPESFVIRFFSVTNELLVEVAR